ncbi:MAG: hypothetical protein EHM56_03885 [Chloroflexi bacterium]|nr:MAG: hypothetical protein EHM56_03885 [Chloroflexota bacterium]
MEFQEAERRYRELQVQRDQGLLDAAQFHLQVAELLLRDPHGTFWMLDGESGAWYSNRGSGWQPADPRVEWPAGKAESTSLSARRLRPLLFILPVVILLAAGGLALLQLPAWPWDSPAATATPEALVKVAIASPGDGDEVPLGQEVGIELTLSAQPGLEVVDRVELRVDGRPVGEQPVRVRLQPGQASLPLSLPWQPAAVGDYRIAVAAVSGSQETLGSAEIGLRVAELSAPAVPKPACLLQASFLSDVTVPPGQIFPPHARVDKVWQVRNSGTCAWGVGYELALVSGDDLGAASPVRVPPTSAGQPSDLGVSFWAPREAGVYRAVWRLRSPQGEFFGPPLDLQIQVRAEAERSVPPASPAQLEARVVEEGKAIQLSWLDRSDNEDAFRVHRQDVEASVGLVPASAQAFVDRSVACGGTFQYSVVAFNAAGASPPAEAPEITMPACAAGSAALPTLILTVVPSQVVTGEPFALVFQAEDEAGLVRVTIRGQNTGNAEFDEGQTFACEGHRCAASWSLTWDGEAGRTLFFVAEAWDVAGMRSEPARAQVVIRPSP